MNTLQHLREAILSFKTSPFCVWDICVRCRKVVSRSTIRKYLNQFAKAGYIVALGGRPGLEKYYKATGKIIPENIQPGDLVREVAITTGQPKESVSEKVLNLSKETKQAIEAYNAKTQQLTTMLSGITFEKYGDVSIASVRARRVFVETAQKHLKDMARRLETLYEGYTLDVEKAILGLEERK